MAGVEAGLPQDVQQLVAERADVLKLFILILKLMLKANLLDLVHVILGNADVLLLDALHLSNVPLDEIASDELKVVFQNLPQYETPQKSLQKNNKPSGLRETGT